MYQPHNPNLLIHCKYECFPPGLKRFHFCAFTVLLEDIENTFQETLYTINKNLLCQDLSLVLFT